MYLALFRRWGLPFAAALALSLFPHLFYFANLNWYVTLAKPVFMPPAIAVYIAWAIGVAFAVYTLGFILESEQAREIKMTFCALFALSGALCGLSAYLFFNAKSFWDPIGVFMANIVLTCLLKRHAQKIIGITARFIVPYIALQCAQVFLCYCVAMVN